MESIEHIPFSKRVTHKNSEDCIVNEYPTKNEELDFATADINGRYPTEGYAVNRGSLMSIYVLSKRGQILYHPDTNLKPIEVSNGDVVTIPRHHPYALLGRMGLLIASTPKWSADQAEIVE